MEETRVEKRRQEVRRHQKAIARLVESNETLQLESRLRRAGLGVPADVASRAKRVRALSTQAATIIEDYHYGSISLRDATPRLEQIERRLEELADAPELSEALQRKLAQIDSASVRREEQAKAVNAKLAEVRKAWRVHPATKLYNKWRTIHPASPLAEEKERVTRLLKDAEDAVELFRLGDEPKRTHETLSAILKQLRRKPSKAALSPEPPVGAAYGDTVRYAVTKEADPASFLTKRLRVTELYDRIDDLWQRHPLRTHLRRLQMFNIERGVLEPSPMYDELDKLEEAWDKAGQAALDFWEGHQSYEQVLPMLLEAKAKLSAVPYVPQTKAEAIRPRQAPTLPANATPIQVCKIVLDHPSVFSDAPRETGGLHITDPKAFSVLASVEGPRWETEQAAHPDSPTTLEVNRIAWTALQAENLLDKFELEDVLDDGGFIHGLEGRIYEVTRDGRIRLMSTSADEDGIERATEAGIEVA
jgi:hypothetical protein